MAGPHGDLNVRADPPDGAGLPVTGRAVMATAYIVQGFYLSLGIVGLLFLASVLAEREGNDLFGVYTLSTAGALVYLAVGLVGPAMTTGVERARLYLIGASGLFIVWAALGLVLNGTPSDLFTGNALVVVTHLVTGLAAGGVVIWADRWPTA